MWGQGQAAFIDSMGTVRGSGLAPWPPVFWLERFARQPAERVPGHLRSIDASGGVRLLGGRIREDGKGTVWGGAGVHVTWPIWKEVAMGRDTPGFGSLRVCLQDTCSPVFQMSHLSTHVFKTWPAYPLFLSSALLLLLPSHSYFFHFLSCPLLSYSDHKPTSVLLRSL